MAPNDGIPTRQMTVGASMLPGRTNSTPLHGQRTAEASFFQCIRATQGYANKPREYAAPSWTQELRTRYEGESGTRQKMAGQEPTARRGLTVTVIARSGAGSAGLSSFGPSFL